MDVIPLLLVLSVTILAMGGAGILFQLYGNLIVNLIVEGQRFDALLQPLEYGKEGGHYEYLNDSTYQHTSHSGGAQSLVTILAYTGSKHQRQQTDNHSQ